MIKFLENLHLLSEYERTNLPYIETLEDRRIILMVGYFQQLNNPIALKQLSHVGSQATIERRIARLKKRGVLVSRRSPCDKRWMELRLSTKAYCQFEKYATWAAGIEL